VLPFTPAPDEALRVDLDDRYAVILVVTPIGVLDDPSLGCLIEQDSMPLDLMTARARLKERQELSPRRGALANRVGVVDYFGEAGRCVSGIT
jgi:hypothetical protein